jgi:hypothetical protein
MGVTLRQAFRLPRAYDVEGPAALISKKRSKAKQLAVSGGRQDRSTWVNQCRLCGFWADFGSEKLAKRQGPPLGVETVRRWIGPSKIALLART